MRSLIFFCLFLVFSATTVWADPSPTSSPVPSQGIADLYRIEGLAIDQTAKNAVAARDNAINAAQRQALTELLTRLNAKKAKIDSLSDGDIATLVKNFEVNGERTSGTRYIGTFSVQFKPNAIHKYLDKQGISYDNTVPASIILLPITLGKDNHPTLWEESTAWRGVWDTASPNAGLVPTQILAGDVDDVGMISTAEAMSGKAEALTAISHHYTSAGVLVAIMPTGASFTSTEPRILDLRLYDTTGKTVKTELITLPPLPSVVSTPANPTPDLTPLWNTAMTLTRAFLDKNALSIALDARHHTSEGDPSASVPPSQSPPPPPTTETSPASSTHHLDINIALNSLAEWAIIKRNLDSIQQVEETEMINLSRGYSLIGLTYNGSIQDLQRALASYNLVLGQQGADSQWYMTSARQGTTPH